MNSIEIRTNPDENLKKYIIGAAAKLARDNYDDVQIINRIIEDITIILNSPGCRVFIVKNGDVILGSAVIEILSDCIGIEHFDCDGDPSFAGIFLKRIASLYRLPLVAQTHASNVRGRVYYRTLGFKEDPSTQKEVWIGLTYAKL